MTVKTCQQCDGNGYHYNYDLGEITGFCPQCDGTGFVESVPSNRINSFHIEIQVQVNEDAHFHEDIQRKVESLGWSYHDYPVQSDLLLQLITDFFSKLRNDGITLKSVAVGKQVIYVNSIDLGGNNNQPTLF